MYVERERVKENRRETLHITSSETGDSQVVRVGRDLICLVDKER